MRSLRSLAFPALLFLLSTPGIRAAESLSEVAALLVFPDVGTESVPTGGQVVETILSVSNSSVTDYVLHVAYINGDSSAPTYCYECDFSVPIGGLDTVTLAVSAQGPGLTKIQTLDTTFQIVCDFTQGFVVVSLEDLAGNTVSNNVLLGRQTVTNYTSGLSYSSGAIPFTDKGGNNGDRRFDFNDVEYGRMPRILGADFIAPTEDGMPQGEFDAYLTLFTLGFERQFPPATTCNITGYDADGNPFSTATNFGCWSRISLEDLSLEFAYPYLGQDMIGQDEHGWLLVDCTVDGAVGGVHGTLFQVEPANAAWAGAGPTINPTAWSRTLIQAVTTGDSFTLILESPVSPSAASSQPSPPLPPPSSPQPQSPVSLGARAGGAR